MKAALDDYEQLAQMYPQTRYGRLAAQYAPSLAEAYRKSVEATRNANPGQQITNTVNTLNLNFGTGGSGRESIPVPIRKGNRITFGQPQDR